MTEVRTVRPPGGLANYARFRLTVSRGPDKGRSVELTSQPLRVGSSSESDLVLVDADVAARHCALEPISDGIRVRDEGSGAPVFVGGLRVIDVIAQPPFELLLGQTSLSLEPLPAHEEREQSAAERFGDLRGRSARMRELFAELGQVALGDGSVLIEGERGSGRQLTAESIHDASGRAAEPFVVVHCSDGSEISPDADPRGALKELTEAFERAALGTLYLHEITLLSDELQAELVRLLGGRSARSDVRLLASSSKNLSAEVRHGFHAELLRALSASRVRIPPLRDRMEDLPLLVEHFLSRSQSFCDSSIIPASVWNAFAVYSWPGNVRELWSTLEAFTSHERLSKEETDARSHVNAGTAPPSSVELMPLRIARRNAAEEFERSYLAALLARTEGNVTRAAAIAEVSRQMVQKLQRKHKVG